MWPFSLFKSEDDEAKRQHEETMAKMRERRSKTMSSTLDKIRAIQDEALALVEEPNGVEGNE